MSALSITIDCLRSDGFDIEIDAIGGASAGSIVGMLFAHCLTTGRDVPSMLERAWIDEVDLDLLRSGRSERSGRSPLAFDDLRGDLHEFLHDETAHPFDVHRRLSRPISVNVALTSLLGFETPVQAGGSADSTLSFVDWITIDLDGADGVEGVTEPAGRSLLDTVLISASHPAAFSPASLDRSSDRAEYEARGITNFPEEGLLWYTDGGLVESRPIGTVITAARRREATTHEKPTDNGQRLHLVIDPRSSGPSGSEQWGSSDGDHSWIAGMRRALSILPTQALHDDLRAIEETNERLERLDELVDDLIAEGIAADRAALRRRIAEATGLDGKERLIVDVISPLVTARREEASVDELLAGDFVGAFGGFLDQSIRRSDFLLGWDSTRHWIDGGLAAVGVGDGVVEEISRRLDEARPEAINDDLEGDGVDQLDWKDRWKLAVVAGRAGRILVSESLPSFHSVVRQGLSRSVGRSPGDADAAGSGASRA